ncbi:hypothetical protein D9619_011742 [Psilocybe cf. subviscida]|uniref:Uncharacterized protein n=1 Tax=Psilocybe cf. subviscida TaxID=2480587 RepID=A0A8H5B0G2_9AGAR|nr:hypothetical protein D9619_011742 [Psilocybe cf. subviscida]
MIRGDGYVEQRRNGLHWTKTKTRMIRNERRSPRDHVTREYSRDPNDTDWVERRENPRRQKATVKVQAKTREEKKGVAGKEIRIAQPAKRMRTQTKPQTQILGALDSETGPSSDTLAPEAPSQPKLERKCSPDLRNGTNPPFRNSTLIFSVSAIPTTLTSIFAGGGCFDFRRALAPRFRVLISTLAPLTAPEEPLPSQPARIPRRTRSSSRPSFALAPLPQRLAVKT